MDERTIAILIEDLRGQFKVFGEARETTNEQLKATNEKLDVFAKATNE